MTRSTRFSQSHAAAAGGVPPKRLERTVSWSDFRAAVRYDPANRLLVAVPAISAKRAEHPWLGEAVTLHARVGEAHVYRREYERGSVYWSERTGAHEAHGAIAERWQSVGGEASFLGLPTTDEQRIAGAVDEAGAATAGFAHFEGGSIFWSARHGAAIVHGMVRDIWALLGWERSALGMPVGDVRYDAETGVLSGCFEHGTIAWSPAGGHEIAITAPAASVDLDTSPGHGVLGRLHTDFAPRG
ncbi:LGFP repeat-containing protein [Agromyces ramosus]|nr:hypothetical protein [Agromyces ramosus]